MDLLHSCYRQKISFLKGFPASQAIATWYFCSPNAHAFPEPHSFGSPTWDTDHPTITTLGFDATSSRTYTNGRRTNSSNGQSYAGPLIYFQEGAPARALLPRISNGTPVECVPPPWGLAGGGLLVPLRAGLGGKLAAGQLVAGVVPGMPCINCVGTTPATVRVVLSGFAGGHAFLNGTWTLPQINPCTWFHSFSAFQFIQLLRVATNHWQLDASDTFQQAQYELTTPDCVTSCVLPLSLSTIGGDPTAPLLIP